MLRLSAFLTVIVLVIVASLYLFAPGDAEAAFDPLQYDANGNGVIERDEVSVGVEDYHAGRITRDNVLTLVIQHFAGETPSLDEMVEGTRPAVVMVVTDLGESVGQGSGFIFEVEGNSAYVLTNQHVTGWASTVQIVVNDKDTYEGTVLGRDADRDLAVVEICCGNFTALEFADMREAKVGDDLVAIGYPLNDLMPRTVQPIYPLPYVSASVTKGVLSAFRYDTERDRRSIQYDAHANPGSSGGPLLSMDGNVLGINTWGITNTDGVKFAVSAVTIQEQLAALKTAQASYAFGPIRGTLYHVPDDGYIETQYADGFWARDIDVRARFHNSFAGVTAKKWSYGLVLRAKASSARIYFMFAVSDGRPFWKVVKRHGSEWTTLGDGWLHSRDAGTDWIGVRSNNLLRSVLRGNQGSFYVNGKRVATLNLGGVTHAGGVAVATGFYNGHEFTNDSTVFEEFQGTSIDGVPLSMPTGGPLNIDDEWAEVSTEFEVRDSD